MFAEAVIVSRVNDLPRTLEKHRRGDVIVQRTNYNLGMTSSPITIVVHTSHRGAEIHATVLGANSSIRAEGKLALTSIVQPLRKMGIAAGRWPGGSLADAFDWQTHTMCFGSPKMQDPSGTFDSYMEHLARPLGLDVELTVNYGSSNAPVCDLPGDPAIAAAWVRYANREKNYGIKWWEIGNEVYGPWELDKHAQMHSATAYSMDTVKFYSAMKFEDPSINVGVPLVGPGLYWHWDKTVIAHAKFDYVTYHFYPERSSNENDETLLKAPSKLVEAVEAIRAELKAGGRGNTPISISEWNSVPDRVDRQSVSIVNGLFVAETLGEMLTLGIQRAEFWSDYGCQSFKPSSLSSAVYGWQDFGSQGLFAPTVPTRENEWCHWSHQHAKFGTLFPTGRAFELYYKSGFVTNGEHMLGVSVGAAASVRAYAASHGSGVALILVNLSRDTTLTVAITIDSIHVGSRYSWMRYGKEEYDKTRGDGPWVEAANGSTGSWSGPIYADLPPWSISSYTIAP